MTLKDRLSVLHRQQGRMARERARSTIRERVHQLRPGQGSGTSRIADRELAHQVAGRVLAPGLLLVEHRIHWGQRKMTSLQRSLEAAAGLWVEFAACRLPQIVFLDTETTGLSGGSGTLIFLLGLARFAGPRLTTRQFLLTRFAAEEKLLAAAAEGVDQDSMLLTFNGKSYDLPLLATRCRMSGLPDSFLERAHFDLLHPVRRGFARCWPDCCLATAERELLGLQRAHDLPGSAAPQAWFDWVRRKEPGGLAAVVQHNRRDILSLVELLPPLVQSYLVPGTHGADVHAVARAWLSSGDEVRARELLLGGRAGLGPAGQLELARLLRRAGRWPEALAIWDTLAQEGCLKASERLAVYHEHVTKDFPRALEFARRLPHGGKRLERLYRKSDAQTKAKRSLPHTAGDSRGIMR